MAFSFLDRSRYIQELRQKEFDLVIIGGGINGVGVARDAALRGMKVALIESDDFASGTSSRSSKLIHGGIRYLENLEFGLVFEALSERRKLFAMAPHLVHPLRFVIPLYEGGRVGMLKMGLGMFLYDALALFETPEPHERLSKKELAQQIPALNGSHVLGGYAYSDAYMDDDRLVLETLRSAVSAGTTAVSYVEAVGAVMTGGKLSAVNVQDRLSGQSFSIKGRHFISTVGPWVDEVAPRLVGQWQKQLRPSKGVHLTFAREKFPLPSAVVMAAEARIVFAIPRHEMVIVGTTDTDFSGSPREVCTERRDVDYILRVMAQYFPGANVSEADILASYSGVRPLVDDQSATESKTSREHLILEDERNITFVMGGKYTTYRLIAEQTVLAALKQFSTEEQVKFGKSETTAPLNPLITSSSYADMPLVADELRRSFGLSKSIARLLAERHGAEAIKLCQRTARDFLRGNGMEPWAKLEALHAIDQTMCGSLRDFYLRRTPLFLSQADHGFSLLDPILQMFAGKLNWDKAKVESQKQELIDHMRQEMGWRQKNSTAAFSAPFLERSKH